MGLFSRKQQKQRASQGVMSQNGRQSTAPDVKPIGAVAPDRGNRTSRGIFSGDVLYSQTIRRHYPFALYCCLLIILYMGYIFNCQRTQREEIASRIELQKVRSRALLLSSERLEAVRHSNLTEEIQRRGLNLQQWNTPPVIIRRNESRGER